MNKGKERKIKMKKSKMEKGITLIALIITIVVLLILAAVAITAITEYNIIENANSAAQKYGDQANLENTTLGMYNTELDKYMGGATGGNGSGEGSGEGTGSESGEGSGSGSGEEEGSGSGSGEGEGTGSGTVLAIANKIQESNTKVEDEFGNQIVVPAGFMIRVDEDAGTKGDEKSTATNVTEGIVIEDASGNQFVWVPVGKIYTTTDEATKETTAKTITLGRYSNFTATDGVYTPTQSAENYATATTINSSDTEDTAENHNSEYGNAIARNIGDFVASATQNKGYYIGRFEAGKDNNNTLVCKAGQAVYASITQPNASTACKNMYNEGVDGYNANKFSSDLINSYAWDTAIIFIQTFGGENEYYKQNKSTSFTTTGGNQDEYCNINDMSGNYWEWSTETYGNSRTPCVHRGGYYYSDHGGPKLYTSYRYGNYPTYTYSINSFRPLLYVAL